MGDARLRLAEAADGKFDMIVLDAFSSDSIPMHLLTEEALDLYLAKLKVRRRARAAHQQPVFGVGADAGPARGEKGSVLHVAERMTRSATKEQENGKRASHYMVMARRESDVGPLAKNKKWEQPDPFGQNPSLDRRLLGYSQRIDKAGKCRVGFARHFQ